MTDEPVDPRAGDSSANQRQISIAGRNHHGGQVPRDATKSADRGVSPGPQVAVDRQGLIDLALGLAAIPSQIPNEHAVAEYLAAEMDRLGIFSHVELQPVVPGRCNVIGVVPGAGGGPTIMLNGHLDTVPPAGEWSRDPYDTYLEGDRLYGLGLTDMKGGVACMVKAAQAVAQSVTPRLGDLVVAAVVHHDVCGLGTKFFLESSERRADYAIVCEPTDLAVQVAHGGAWQFQLTTRGRAVHCSRSEDGVDAIAKMLTVIDAFRSHRFGGDRISTIAGLPRLTIGVMQAGRTPSELAASCIAQGDLRFPPGVTIDSIIREVQTLIRSLEEHDPDLQVELRTLASQTPFDVSPASTIVGLVTEAHLQISGQPASIHNRLPVGAYVTDAADLSRHGIETVVYGPGNWTLEPDENISVNDLTTAAHVYATVAAQIITTPA